MPDMPCWTCKELWDIAMEPDAGIKAVRQLVEDDYGEGFTIVDVGGVVWAVQRCPSCPDGVETVTDMDDDVLQSAYGSL